MHALTPRSPRPVQVNEPNNYDDYDGDVPSDEAAASGVSESEALLGGRVYAIGDCAVNEAAPLPPTAQVAEQQADYLAACFNQGLLRGRRSVLKSAVMQCLSASLARRVTVCTARFCLLPAWLANLPAAFNTVQACTHTMTCQSRVRWRLQAFRPSPRSSTQRALASSTSTAARCRASASATASST
jgi:hypothetical protein